jgi:ABC-2 type transport system permease protein
MENRPDASGASAVQESALAVIDLPALNGRARLRPRTDRGSFQRIASVARKELLHILRDRATLMMTLFFPVVEMIMLGYAIDTNVRFIPTVVLDQSKTQQSRQLLQSFENSEDFKVVARVETEQELTEAIISGKARVGIKIPENFARKPPGLVGEADTAQILILVDGSISSVAGEAVNVGNAIALRESLERSLGDKPLPIEARPRVLFNPDMFSANFFIPGLMVVLCQMMAVTLSANAIVREKENGTLEQLYMTPVRPTELILGKLAPYLVLTLVEFCGIAALMRTVFGVPIHGIFLTLLAIALPFLLMCLAFGLWVSTRVNTREAAMQMAMATMMPSIFLSGYVFPLDSMPVFFWWVAQFIPTTWLVDASRGVILRGAGWMELWPHAAVLWSMAIAMLVFSTFKVRKRIT